MLPSRGLQLLGLLSLACLVSTSGLVLAGSGHRHRSRAAIRDSARFERGKFGTNYPDDDDFLPPRRGRKNRWLQGNQYDDYEPIEPTEPPIIPAEPTDEPIPPPDLLDKKLGLEGLPSDCGRFNLPPPDNPEDWNGRRKWPRNGRRIAGGWPASPGMTPHFVQISTPYNPKVVCGGSIISKRHVITAQHCVQFEPNLSFGQVLNPNGRKIRPEKICRDPLWGGKAPHDIAILRMPEDIEFDNFTQPICLPTSDAYPLERLHTIGMGLRPVERDPLYPNSAPTVWIDSQEVWWLDTTVAETCWTHEAVCYEDQVNKGKTCEGDSGSGTHRIRNGRSELVAVLYGGQNFEGKTGVPACTEGNGYDVSLGPNLYRLRDDIDRLLKQCA